MNFQTGSKTRLADSFNVEENFDLFLSRPTCPTRDNSQLPEYHEKKCLPISCKSISTR